MAAISEGEVAVYDRQLRLWGVQAQQRLLRSRVLVWGLEGNNVELCKNLVLAGASLTLRDHRTIAAEDVAFNYFLASEDVGANRAACASRRVQEMNPLNKVGAVETSPETDPAALKKSLAEFDVIVVAPGVLGWNMELACQIDDSCRAGGASFFLSMGVGQLAFFFSDMGDHEVREKSSTQGEAGSTASEAAAPPAPELIKFPSLREWLAISPADMLKQKTDPSVVLMALIANFLKLPCADGKSAVDDGAASRFQSYCQDDAKCVPKVDGVDSLAQAYSWFLVEPLVHVASVLGGLLSQEVIKAITKRDVPLVNSICFSAFTNAAFVERLPAEVKPVKRKAVEAALDLDD